MSIFTIQAKVQLNTENVRDSNLVAVKHTIDQVSTDGGYILEQYMNIKHNLLHRTWTAALTRWRKRRIRIWRGLLKKRYNAKKTCKIKMYIYVTNTETDRPVLSSGRTPHEKQNRNCLDYSQNLVTSVRGAQCQDGLTAWLTDSLNFSCKGTLTLTEHSKIIKYFKVIFWEHLWTI